jgi:hypothetical protein
MFKLSRNAISFLLSLDPFGDIPPMGGNSHAVVGETSLPPAKESKVRLSTVAHYYEALQELCSKGIIRSGRYGYCLTPEG